MSKTFKVNEDVIKFVDEIIEEYQLNPIKEVKFKPGSEVGDNYASQTVAVTIVKPEGIIELFLKCALDIKSSEVMPIDKLYANEIYFYDTVYPAYLKFLKRHNLTNKNTFHNVPKCYGTFKKNIVALENLKRKGFKLFPRNEIINDNHVKLVLETFAKFHAISFAFKDQDKMLYDELEANSFDFLSAKNGETPFISIIRGSIKDFIKKLDPDSDKVILNRCDVEDLISCVTSADTNLDQFSILTQGDCWCNNMMFLYEVDGDLKKPIDMMLIDWQLLRPASPVYDISYFFLSIAPEGLLDRTEEFLKVYHDELSRRIKEMGSDPDVLYPFSVLLQQWKKYCRFGFGMATIIMKVMLSEKDEAFNLEEMDFENTEQLENLYSKFENEDEYVRRMKILANYMIKNDYI